MSTIDENGRVAEYITELRAEGKSYREISECLHTMFPGYRGFSDRSIRRFCEKRGIHRSARLKGSDLNRVVATAVKEVSYY